ncbi:HAD family hydrolase [Streptosporangium saharense]|uniref:FMN phosphatase YigB (HAD superfamily) n=1 Tax=Streptosporangium saharense TaxID=1706840 RepID=A0A7W7VQP6_9ACTN|nr:HAD family hydrolase [Streptosporangium saharense]MBB4919257.1 FMN phosphatase YigB (HAD superfamily) [Streptosporangium saharense]
MTGRFSCAALDYSSTLTRPGSPVDPGLGMRRITPAAIEVIHELHEAGMILVLASNTRHGQDRREALRRAGVLEWFTATLQSATLGVAKPDPLFYRFVLAAADVAPSRVLFVGDNMTKDVLGPLEHGMRAALITPDATPLPPGAETIPDITHLPNLIRTWR